MSDFYYEARDETGQTISGRIRAMDVKDAIRQLEANQWDVVSVRTVPKPAAEPDAPVERALRESASEDPAEEPYAREVPRFSRKDSVELAGHLADVMQAGLPLVPGLSALANELPDGKVRRGLKVMVSQLEAGRGLESVLESRHVPADLRGLVRAGLRSGHTGEVLSQYVRHMQQMLDLRRRMALAWGYPLVLILSAGAIFFFFIWFIVPQFTDIYEDFGTELPSLTQSLVWFSKLIHEDGPLLLAFVGGALILFWLFWRFILSPSQRRRFLWCLPIVGKMIRSAALARFSRLLGLLIENDVPLPDALRLAGRGAADAELGEAALYLADVVESGRPLTGNEYACQRFPATFVQLLSQIENQKSMAEAMHTLADACTSSARMFESQARVAASRITAVCQPLIVIFTGCTVGYLVLALFLPLIKLLNDLS
jgi:type II secretory pathway component PulF